MYKTPTRGTRQVQDTAKGYKACTSALQVYKIGTRHLQGVQGRCKILTRSIRQI